jgi:hypothetical protein
MPAASCDGLAYPWAASTHVGTFAHQRLCYRSEPCPHHEVDVSRRARNVSFACIALDYNSQRHSCEQH